MPVERMDAPDRAGLTTVSVVIPTSRGGSDLDECLRSLEAQDYPDLDVVVVDNGAPDALADVHAGELRLRILHNERNRGYAEACNQGVEAVRGELVLLLNDDTEVEPGGLRALVRALESRPAWGACQAKLLLHEDPSRLDTAGSFLTATGFLVHRGAFGPAERFDSDGEIFAAKGAALLVRARAFAETGGFDPDFFAYFEESDLCWRLWLAGWQVGFAADARVLHRLGKTARTLPSELIQFHSFKNRVCSLLKNLGGRRLAWMLPLHVGICLGLAVWYGIGGQAAVGRAILRALLWNVRNLYGTLRKRTAIQSRRRVRDEELMPQITQATPLRTLLAYARGDADKVA